jgi:midasin
VARQLQEVDTSLSLQSIQLSDSCSSQLPVLTQLSHQLCEQLRLILEPTKASKLQGDFRTGKRLNMRKIIPYIASQFKKNKIWLRRVKPNKREFQILVALDDSSSMSDNQTREIALSSLNTLSSALALLEVGQMGVLRFGKAAEIIHSLGVLLFPKCGTQDTEPVYIRAEGDQLGVVAEFVHAALYQEQQQL